MIDKKIALVRWLWLYPGGYRLNDVINRYCRKRYIKTHTAFWRFAHRFTRYPQWLTQFFLKVIVKLDCPRNIQGEFNTHVNVNSVASIAASAASLASMID